MSETLWVGTRKGLFQLRRANDGWKITASDFLGVQVPMFLADRHSGWKYAALKHGHFGAKFHRSEGGNQWEEVSPPVYPEKPDDVPDVIDPMRNIAIPWSLELVWALEAAPRARPEPARGKR